MKSLINQIDSFTEELEKKLTDSNEDEISTNFLKNLYNIIVKEGETIGVPKSETAADELCVDGFDAEGIFQQFKHHNIAMLPLADYDMYDAMDTESLSARVVILDGALKSEGYVNLYEDEGVEDMDSDSDNEYENETQSDPESGLEVSHSSDEEQQEKLDDESVHDSDSNDDDDGDETEEDKSVDEKDVSEEENPFGSDIDFDADTFGDIKLDENEDEEETEDEMHGFEDIESVKEREKKHKKKKKSKETFDDDIMDSDMFDKEVEIDEDLLDALYESDNEEPNGETDAVNAKFADFFESAESYDEYVKSALKKQVEEDQPQKEDEEDEDADMDFEDLKKESEAKSTHGEQLGKKEKIIKSIEDKNVAAKPWYFTGEAVKDSRPEGSAIEEYLEKKLTVIPEIEETEKYNSWLEKMIIKRFRNKAFDDVERVEKAAIDCFQMKKKLEISGEKSQKSLADLYAEDYAKAMADKPKEKVNLLTGKVEDTVEDDEKKQKLKNELDEHFSILDALYNYHYTAPVVNPDITIVNLTPAISMEEATPMTASDATVLAPEEIFKAPRGDLLGKSEKTTTDRQRERRRKKARQHRKAVAESDNLNKQLKNRGDNLPSQDASVKFVTKAVKNNQIHTLKAKGDGKKMTSTNFFETIQQKVHEGVKTKKRKAESFANPNKSKKSKGPTTAKQMLL